MSSENAGVGEPSELRDIAGGEVGERPGVRSRSRWRGPRGSLGLSQSLVGSMCGGYRAGSREMEGSFRAGTVLTTSSPSRY